MKPIQKRESVKFFRIGFKVSERRACKLAGICRSTTRYQSQAKDQAGLRIRIRDLAGSRVRYGYRRLHVLLQREGWKVNHKRVYRIYRLDGLSLCLKTKKKRASSPRVPCPAATCPNDRWSMDFVADRLANGRAYRTLTLVDNVSKVSPAIEVDFALSGKRVTIAQQFVCKISNPVRLLCF
ncbi:MAG: transposase [Akkermansiaceae bacterium]|nr:transposase [Armatimonadota bacterium]